MRLYFDENFSPHLAHAFRELEKGRPGDAVEVFHMTDEFPRGTPDEDWISAIAMKHGSVLTQDLNIQRTRLLCQICSENKIGLFFFRPPKRNQFDYWDWAHKVLAHWAEIKVKARSTKRPFAFYAEPHKSKLMPAS
jgi:hypothetical protein